MTRVDLKDYQSDVENQWCPGCGNFAILAAVKQALVELELAPHQVLIVSGIGQAPKLPHYLKVNTLNGLHGREVAEATAAKLAADDLTVLVHAGDGGAYGEGGNHLLHAIRRNVDVTLVVHDNAYYGLTKGQPSPTGEQGAVTKLNPPPLGVIASPLNPLALAISQGCGFVAQGLASRIPHLTELLKRAISHRGFSLLNVLQPCVTWDRVHTYDYYAKHCYEIGDEHDSSDSMQALGLALRSGKHEPKIPLGVFYVNPRPSYESIRLKDVTHPLRDRGLDPRTALKLFDEFR